MPKKSQIHLMIEGDDELAEAFKNRQPGDEVTLRAVRCELLENTEKDVVLEVKGVEVDLPGESRSENSDADDGGDDEGEAMGDAVSRPDSQQIFASHVLLSPVGLASVAPWQPRVARGLRQP